MYSEQFKEHAKQEIESLRAKARFLESLLGNVKEELESEEENESPRAFHYDSIATAPWEPNEAAKKLLAAYAKKRTELPLPTLIQLALGDEELKVDEIVTNIGDKFTFGKTKASPRVRSELYRMEKLKQVKRVAKGVWAIGKKAV